MSARGFEDGALPDSLRMPEAVRERAMSIALLVLDVDGVMTDGTLYYGADGELLKAFHVHDGLGIKLCQAAGVPVAVITAKTGGPLARRLRDLGIEHALMGREDKRAALDELTRAAGVTPDRIAYVGDDIVDLPVLRQVGLPVAVSNAHALVRREAAWVTARAGGHGAVREVVDGLLDAQGRLGATVDAYLSGARP